MHILLLTFVSCLLISTLTISIDSYPFSVSRNFANLPPSQIDHLCSYISKLQPASVQRTGSSSLHKRFAVPFPDMNRFLSTSHKLHHHDSNPKSGTEHGAKKHDFHAYLCSISKDSEEMSNFISIFIEEHGQAPAFNIFESCEQVAKRDLTAESKNELIAGNVRFNGLAQFCSDRSESRFAKRWKHSVGGPMSIDFIHQMLESRKVKSYPYSAEVDPYLVGR